MNPKHPDEDIERLVEAQDRGEEIDNPDIPTESETPEDGELDVRKNKDPQRVTASQAP